MALMISTGLASGIAGTNSLKNLMDGGEIRLYSGAVPASADAAIGSATLLVTIKKDGLDPLALTADGPAVRRPTGDTWKGTPVATGAATFFRHVQAADTDGASTSDVRIQGTVGLSIASNLALIDVNFTSGVERTLSAYSVSIPLKA